MAFLRPDGSSYGGEREHVLHQEVPARPSPSHMAERESDEFNAPFVRWVLDEKAAAIAEIVRLEGTITPRMLREAALGIGGARLEAVEEAIAAERAKLK